MDHTVSNFKLLKSRRYFIVVDYIVCSSRVGVYEHFSVALLYNNDFERKLRLAAFSCCRGGVRGRKCANLPRVTVTTDALAEL